MSCRRFNLLLLDYDEVLFESLAVIKRSEGISREGRLWICSRCLVFEPKRMADALEKYPLENISNGPINTDDEAAFSIETTLKVQMKTRNISHPYVKIASVGTIRFDLKHGSMEQVYALIKSLWEIRKQVVAEPRAGRTSIEMKLLEPITNPRLLLEFDASRLHDFRETILTTKATRVRLVSQLTNVPGCIMLSDQRLYFQPSKLNNIGEVVQSFELVKLTGLYKRRFLLRHRALEIRFLSEEFVFNIKTPDKSLLVVFEEGTAVRDTVFNLMHGFLLKSPCFVDNLTLPTPDRLLMIREAWMSRKISNFEYLSHLNTLADRSTADLTQYPVFPWVITDYTSSTLDLKDPTIFRDLSKPIGALSESRLKNLQERYDHMLQDPDTHIPPFLYGTHYTTPGYVLYFLLRKSPDLMLRLQNGHFDKPDRSFNSIADTWNSVLNNPADLKELIPEFYDSDGDFLLNLNQLDLGRKQDGSFVEDVILPPWCSGPRDFVNKSREALESEYVSTHLNEWIDLIFGYKQRGDAAVKSNNLFYHLTYEGAVDLDQITDPEERRSYEAQIYEFGQTPKQLFFDPHPQRKVSTDEALLPEKVVVETIEEQDMEEHNLEVQENETRMSHKELHKDIKPPTPKEENRTLPESKPGTESKLGIKSSQDITWWSRRRTSSSSWTHQSFVCANEIKVHRGVVSGMCVSETQLFSVSHDCSISVVDLQSQTIVQRSAISKLALSCCATSLNGNVVVGSWDNSVYLWSPVHGRVISRFSGHEDAVSCIAVAPEQNRCLVTGSWESSVKVWSLRDNVFRLNCSIYDHESEIVSVDTTASGNLIASSSARGHVMVHDTRTGSMVNAFSLCLERGTQAVSVNWVVNDNAVMTCSRDGVVDMFDLRGNDKLMSSTDILLSPMTYVTTATVAADGSCAILSSNTGKISLCDISLLNSSSGAQRFRTIWKPAIGSSVIQPPPENFDKFNMFSNMPDDCISSIASTVDVLFSGDCGGTIRLLQPS